jgi:hypothetical protein
MGIPVLAIYSANTHIKAFLKMTKDKKIPMIDCFIKPKFQPHLKEAYTQTTLLQTTSQYTITMIHINPKTRTTLSEAKVQAIGNITTQERKATMAHSQNFLSTFNKERK